MKAIIEKISSYNLFNYLFPGVLYVIILNKITTYNLVQENILIGVFLYYFIGLVISRIGSLVIEPILKKVFEFAKYSDFINASKQDNKIELFSEINNMYRTLISLFVMLLISKLYKVLSANFNLLDIVLPYLLIISLIIIFVFSFKKQTAYIVKRVNHHKGKSKEVWLRLNHSLSEMVTCFT